jgi:preprotein translocase subunit Sec63
MAISDRFLKFLKVELNDFLGKYEEEKPKTTPKKETNWTDTVYDFFNGKSSPKEDNTQNSSQDQSQNRQNRRSRNRSSQQQSEQDDYSSSSSSSSSWQNTNTDPEAKYYEALEIKSGASMDEIKAAYRQVMKKYHPDKFASDPEKQKYAEQLAQKINEAYDYLKKKHGA